MVSTFKSADGIHNVHFVSWEPVGEPKMILQISHGMIEFVERYEHFATFLADRGVLVVGNDHIGHGKSVNDPKEWGYFAKDNGAALVIEDLHHVFTVTREKYPEVPYFILGHSMGSYLLRGYLTKYSGGLTGAIIMGTGMEAKIATDFGKTLTRIIAAFKGWEHRSRLIVAISQGGAYKNFDCTGEDSSNSWLTRDEQIVKWYYNEPACTYTFTLNGYYNLFDAVELACNRNAMKKINKNLPLFIVSGDKDPVGNMSKGVLAAARAYKEAGIADVSVKLYEDSRHEILNDLDRDKVMNDIYNWMTEHI